MNNTNKIIITILFSSLIIAASIYFPRSGRYERYDNSLLDTTNGNLFYMVKEGDYSQWRLVVKGFDFSQQKVGREVIY